MSTLLAGAVLTLIFCAPGYPGGAGDAQPVLDAFTAAAAQAAQWPSGSLVASYEATEAGGLAKLENPDAALAFVTFPFFVEHVAALKLLPLVQADMATLGVQERWTLVAKKGAINTPAAMSAYSILSIAGYAPDFVRDYALADWVMPAGVKISQNAQVLSALRRVVAGEPVTVLLDGTQTNSLASLPFANEIQAIRQSAPLPTAVLAIVNSRLPKARAEALRASLLTLSHSAAGADALAGLRLRGFVLPQLPSHTAAP
jgi:hypothetical protein